MMVTVKKVISAALACAALAGPVASAAWAAGPPSGSTYVVDGARVHYHYSQVVGQLYELDVALPPNYGADPNRQYPVVYVLDGQWDFTMVRDIVGKTNYDGMVPDVITVGITWGGKDDDPNTLRARDYVPSQSPFIENSGGASNFLDALETELMPFIDDLYQSNDQAVLMGSSFGGLFTSFVMVERPSLFDGYIAMAAPYGLEAPYFFDKLAVTSNSDYLKGIRAYFGAGTLDGNRESVQAFVDALQSGSYSGLEIEHSEPYNLGHSGGSIVGYTEGLQYIFERPEIALPDALLQRYAGEYASDLGGDFPPVSVTIRDGQLFLQIPNQPDQAFVAESETAFYVKGVNFSLDFSEVSGSLTLVVNSQGAQYPFTKVPDAF